MWYEELVIGIFYTLLHVPLILGIAGVCQVLGKLGDAESASGEHLFFAILLLIIGLYSCGAWWTSPWNTAQEQTDDLQAQIDSLKLYTEDLENECCFAVEEWSE